MSGPAMNTPCYTPLPGRGVLSVSGPDARDFLQGLITADIRRATPEQAVYAALLSPQGKLLHDFFIGQRDGALLMDCEAARKDELTKLLALYKLRSKVTVEDISQRMSVAAVHGENAAGALGLEDIPGRAAPRGSGICFVDPRLARLGARCILERTQGAPFPNAAESPPGRYELLRLEAGVPDGGRDFIAGRSFPLELGIDALHGVDFAKGCYVGQEVTARSRHRGGMRKALYRVRAVEDVAVLPPPDTPVLAGGKDIGLLRSCLGGLGLAILRREEAEQAAANGISLMAGGVTLSARLPEWFPAQP